MTIFNTDSKLVIGQGLDKDFNLEKELNRTVSYKKFSMYRRGWRITVVPKDKFDNYQDDEALVLSSHLLGKGALHCTFRVQSSVSVPCFGTVTIYNVSKDTIRSLVDQGSRVIIEAGYQDGVFGKIWDGQIYQFIEYRQNVVDKVLILHCMQPYEIFKNCYVMAHISKEENNMSGRYGVMTRQIIVNSNETKTVDAIKSPEVFSDDETDDNKSFRGAVMFGSFEEKFNESIAANPKLYISINDGSGNTQITVTDPYKTPQKAYTDMLVVSPQSGLIGTPTNVPKGVNFKCLLDPRLKYIVPQMLIQLTNSETIVAPQSYGSGYFPMFENEGVYRVVSVTHTGNTRGQEWYSECDCMVDPSMMLSGGT